MLITRKLGKILRGKATPFQLVAACVLGALLGFAPGLLQGPALVLLLVALLLVVNANLGVALVVAALAKLLSFVAAPVSFEIGRFLLDGPTSGVARAVVNAPVLAWCGFQYYAVAGGQVLGLALGLVLGFLLASAVGRFRRRMAAAQGRPSRMRELAGKPGMSILVWLVFGGTGGKTWEEKLQRRVGNPVRIWGAVLLVLAVAGLVVGHRALAGPLARRGTQAGLERLNGATVDVGAVALALREGRFGVQALAMADPNALERDLFRAEELSADVDQVDVLRRRVHVARLAVRDAKSGAPRETPGERLAEPADEVYEEPAPGADPDAREWRSLEDVLAEAEVWKDRLAQARKWIDALARRRAEDEEAAETLSERLERQVREAGWFSAKADHLAGDAPTFRLSELVVDGLDASFLPGRVLDVRGSELSTQPWLVDAPPRLSVASRDGEIGFEIDLAPVSRGGGDGALRFHWKGLPVDEAMARLRLPGQPPLRGGTLDLEIDGAWADGRVGHVDLPLKVTLHDTVLAVEGMEPTSLDELELPIGLAGPIDSPRVRFEPSTLTDALVAAGKRELAERVRGALDEELEGKLEEIRERAGVELPGDAGGAEEELKERAKGALEGLLGGKKEEEGGGGTR